VVAAVVILLAVVALAPDLMKPIYERLDALIFKKSETTSFDDRTRYGHTSKRLFRHRWIGRWLRLGDDIELVRRDFEQYRHFWSGAAFYLYPPSLHPALPQPQR
jgi:hypothetical protein